MKKIITLVAILFATSLIVRAGDNIPSPNDDPSGNHNKPTYENDHAGPVGTATALLVTLGAGAVAYRIRKGKKVEE